MALATNSSVPYGRAQASRRLRYLDNLGALSALAAIAIGVVSSPVAAQAQLHSAYPIRFIDRPLTLPSGLWAASSELDYMLWVPPGGDAASEIDARLSGSLGISDALEVQLRYRALGPPPYLADPGFLEAEIRYALISSTLSVRGSAFIPTPAGWADWTLVGVSLGTQLRQPIGSRSVLELEGEVLLFASSQQTILRPSSRGVRTLLRSRAVWQATRTIAVAVDGPVATTGVDLGAFAGAEPYFAGGWSPAMETAIALTSSMDARLRVSYEVPSLWTFSGKLGTDPSTDLRLPLGYLWIGWTRWFAAVGVSVRFGD